MDAFNEAKIAKHDTYLKEKGIGVSCHGHA
jgi:hypothetical protein